METRNTRSTLSTWVAIASITGVIIAILGFTFEVFKWNKEAAEQKKDPSPVVVNNNTHNETNIKIEQHYKEKGKVSESPEEMDEAYTESPEKETALEKLLFISGNIGGKNKSPYEMRLFHKKDGNVKGYYFYTKMRQPILLDGYFKDGVYSIKSFGDFPEQKEIMEFHLVGDAINGTWSNGKKPLDILGFVKNDPLHLSAR